ncbi:Exosome complex component 10 homolog [Caenorhabditis elegans]|nr:HRDC domain-containing protein [Caenorhabditis elegans]CAD59140.2 HRDC domain-containing protein [Caenorhabditis elegans]|eukprot:NP_001309468.1 Cell-death-Related Nuclease [Caenorhabditis elegans]
MPDEEQKQSEEEEEMIRKRTLAMRKKVEEIMRNGAGLVRESNGLPKAGADYELYNSYPTFNTFMKRSEQRLNALMNKVTKSIGCAMRVPDVGSSVEHYTECVIEAQDNIAERAATLHEALKKAELDEIVKVPEFITKAAPTNRKTEAEVSAAMRTFSANIGTVLAEKFRERREEAAQMVVLEKPQKTYNISSDNSQAPFSSKLTVKHHAIEKRTGIVLHDDDESGRRDWISAETETEEEHPYIAEILHFKVPEAQLKSAECLKFTALKDTPLTMIDTKEKLEALTKTLNSVKEFAVDLEHHQMRSYLGLTCLIQISTRDEDFIIDPFPIWDHVGMLNEPFANPRILKVFHGSDSDVLWLQRDYGVHVVNLFDTYVAMKKLKYPKFSLAYLTLRFADVVLDKQYQLADWRARPLRNAMINYAREDTHYLLYSYDMLREQLLKQDTKDLANVYSESSDLCIKVYKKPVFNPKGYLTEIKFRFTLNTRQDYALTHLFKWRDVVARAEDESPHFVLPNHMMLSLSETLPRDVGGIYACCNPLPYFVKQRTGDILKIIVEARDVKLEKVGLSAKERNDAQEARGVMNDTMDHITSVLKSKIDFSHTRFDEERGEIYIDKTDEGMDIELKDHKESLLSVLQTAEIPSVETMIVVEKGKKSDNQKVKKLLNELDKFVTPFECYQMMMITKEKQEEEERKEAERKKLEEGDLPKTMFSHHDAPINRKPEFDAKLLNVDTLKLVPDDPNKPKDPEPSPMEESSSEPQIFDPSRFTDDQLLSKKAMKRKRDAARRNIDVSVVLGESSSSSDPKKKKSDDDAPVEDFDYEKADSSAFEKPVRDNNADFDPFHQKYRLKNKTKKNMAMKKSSNRQGTINYKK